MQSLCAAKGCTAVFLHGVVASCSFSAHRRGAKKVAWDTKKMTCSLLQRHMGTVPYTLAASHSLYLATKKCIYNAMTDVKMLTRIEDQTKSDHAWQDALKTLYHNNSGNLLVLEIYH